MDKILQHLTVDSLLDGIHATVAGPPDSRSGRNKHYVATASEFGWDRWL